MQIEGLAKYEAVLGLMGDDGITTQQLLCPTELAIAIGDGDLSSGVWIECLAKYDEAPGLIGFMGAGVTGIDDYNGGSLVTSTLLDACDPCLRVCFALRR